MVSGFGFMPTWCRVHQGEDPEDNEESTITKVTRSALIDASQEQVKITLPAGTVAWKVFPVSLAGERLDQAIAHRFSLDGQDFLPGETASDQALIIGDRVSLLEAKQFAFPAGAGCFRLVWAWLNTMPIGEVIQIIGEEDASPIVPSDNPPEDTPAILPDADVPDVM